MICDKVKNIALYIFWNCLDEKKRQENIKEHNFSLVKVEDMKHFEENKNQLDTKITLLKKELLELRNEIHNNSRETIINKIDKLLEEI